MKMGIIIVLAVVALVAVVTAVGYFEYNKASPQGQAQEQAPVTASATQPTAQETMPAVQETQTEEPAAPAAPSINEEAAVYDEEFSFSEFPAVKTGYFDVGRYRVYFETDYNIQFVMYSEQRYNEWKSSGMHTISKITTKQGTSCCAESGTWTIDINDGEAGTYYFVFDASKVSGKPTKGKVTVEKISDL